MLVKITLDGDVRRLRIEPDIEISAFKQEIIRVFKLSTIEFQIKWKDDEEELITLATTADLADCIKSETATTLRFQIILDGSKQVPVKATAVPSSKKAMPASNPRFNESGEGWPPFSFLDGPQFPSGYQRPGQKPRQMPPQNMYPLAVQSANGKGNASIPAAQTAMGQKGQMESEEVRDMFQFLFGNGANGSNATKEEFRGVPSRDMLSHPALQQNAQLKETLTEAHAQKISDSGMVGRGNFNPPAQNGEMAPPKEVAKKKQRKRKAKGDASAASGSGTEVKGEQRQVRNRISAKRSRLRKENYLDSLMDMNELLETENTIMHRYLQKVTGQRVFLRDVNASLQAPHDAHTPADGLGREGCCLVRSLQSSERSFILTDAHLPDNPIVFASDHFIELTGYRRQDILGRNCRFLQGRLTCPRAVMRIRDSIIAGRDVATTLINYKRNCKPFWNQLSVYPMRDVKGEIVKFVGMQIEVRDQQIIAEVWFNEKQPKRKARSAAADHD